MSYPDPPFTNIRFLYNLFLIFILLPGVSAVLFVASISEFDQILFEDSTTNRMVSDWKGRERKEKWNIKRKERKRIGMKRIGMKRK